jgi:hypothetical protein
MIREFITSFSNAFRGQMAAPRRLSNAPLTVWFDADGPGERAEKAAPAACLAGEMIDLSRTGIAFSVLAIRVKEKYLVGQDRPLNIEIDMPKGKLYLRALGKRYERISDSSSVERFEVGAEILELDNSNRALLNDFLRRRPRRSGSHSPTQRAADG